VTRVLASNLFRGAAEALGVVAAFVAGGLGLGALEREALGPRAPYPLPASMGAPGEEQGKDGGAPGEATARAVWLVDGFNVLCAGVRRGRERSAFWSEASRAKLLERVARFDECGARVIVVFDGQAPAPEPQAGGPESVFAGSADEWIVARVRDRGSERVTVVTADRQLAGRARHRGAEVVSPLRFLARCEPASLEPGER
jgi:predicted RNA-binding protein with PIN domain